MPRNRRAAAPDTDAQSDADHTPQSPAPEPATAQPAPRRRRTRAAAPAAELTAQSPSETEPAAAPVRRGGRRTKSTPELVAPVVTPEPIIETEAPVADTTPKRGRGRVRKTGPASVASPVAADALPEPNVQITDVVPAPDAASTGSTPLPAPVHGRRRRSVSPPPSADSSPSLASDEPNAEAPQQETSSSQAADNSPAIPEAPARRRGGRRRATADTDPAPPIVELEAPVADEAGSESSNEDDSAPRGRRRRSRRRRGGDIESSADVVEGSLLPEEAVLEPTDDEDLALDVALIAPTILRYEAPALVPSTLAPAAGATLPRVDAHLSQPSDQRGLPQIVINAQDHAPFFFFVNTETAASGEVVDSQVRAAASAGIHLYSGIMYLPFKNVHGERSFGAIDALLQQILNADPDAYLLPRLQCVPTNYWARTHPDELAQYADGTVGDVSMASQEFWADCVDALEALIGHLADPATIGGDRVIGFHLDKGEWFYDREVGYDYSAPNLTAYQNWLHAKYQQPYALRAAWFQGTATFEDVSIPPWTPPASRPETMPVYSSRRDQQWPDYAQFASDLVAEAITGLAAAVKTLSEKRYLVAVSYGYTLEFATRNDSGHLALGAVLQSPDIDILAGPNSYAGRGAGSPAAFGAPIDSVALHGKLWLVEDDTKTFLADTETEDVHNPKIAGGADTQAAHQRHFGAALAHRAGVTWMDLWGQGWLNNPEIWRELGGLRDQANHMAQIAPSVNAAPDVVIFVDEASLAYLKSNVSGLGSSLIGKTRDLLLRTGASVGFYLQSDVTHASLPDAKLYLFLNALRVTTAERIAIREKLQSAGKTLAWVYAAGLFDEHGLSEEEIGETVGMVLRIQPWNARGGSQISDARHPLLERLRGVKRTIGQDEILNPSFAVTDPQAIVLGEYASTGAVSLAAREHPAGWKSVFFGDPHLTVELLRGLLTYAGVSLYDTQDDVTYASGDGVLLIHAPFTGQRTLTLPRPATVYDVMEGRIIATNTRSFRVFIRARTSRLFLWGDGEAIERATGLTVPAQDAAASAEAQATAETEAAEEQLNALPDLPAPLALADSAEATLSAAKAMSSLVAGMLSTGMPGSFDTDEGYSASEDYDNAGTLAAALMTDEVLPAEDTDEGSEEAATSAPRSRWQRRRAAMRARREAERQAQQPAADGSLESSAASDARVDIAALLPGLPPRRLPPPLRSERNLLPDDPPSE